MIDYFKLGIPFIIGIALATGIVYTTKEKTVCNCPTIKLPPPCKSIDFDKIKNVRSLTIKNEQYFIIDNDTIAYKVLDQLKSNKKPD